MRPGVLERLESMLRRGPVSASLMEDDGKMHCHIHEEELESHMCGRGATLLVAIEQALSKAGERRA